jgi:hypothetical protein
MIRAHNAPTSFFALRFLVTIALGASFHVSAFAADAATPQDLVIADLKGDVRLSVRGEPRAAQKGNAVDLPATIRTGRASAIELHQGQTTVAAGADTQLDIPATAVRGDLLERVVQSSGNTFYSVAKRGAKKFRVETPYLVAVVKGTQFNVAVQDDAATVSLFEGRLEIRSADGSDVVDLEAGEIAIRRASDTRIRVLRMDTGEPVARSQSSSGGGPAVASRGDNSVSADVATATNSGRTSPGVTIGPGDAVASIAGVEVRQNVDADAGLQSETTVRAMGVNAAVDTGVDLGGGAVNVGADAGVELGDATVNAGVNAGVDLGAGTVNVGADAGVDLGAASVTAGASAAVDLGAGTVDVGADASVDLGAASVTAGASAGVDLGAGTVDIGADAGVDLGAASVTAGASAGVDLGAGTVDIGADAGVDLGAASVTAGVGAGADLGAGTVDLGADVGADLGGVTAGAGVDTGVDLGAGSVTAGIDAGADLGGGLGAGLTTDTGVDLGAGTIDTGVGLTAGGTTVGAGLDLGGGSVSAGVTVGDLDLGLDLGAGGVSLDVGGSTSTGGTTTGGSTVGSTVGGLVGGLLGGLGGGRKRP